MEPAQPPLLDQQSRQVWLHPHLHSAVFCQSDSLDLVTHGQSVLGLACVSELIHAGQGCILSPYLFSDANRFLCLLEGHMGSKGGHDQSQPYQSKIGNMEGQGDS